MRPPPPDMPPNTRAEETANVAVGTTRGLTNAQADVRRAKYGWNELPKQRVVSPAVVFFRQFTSFLVVILIVAAVIAFFLGDRIDTVAIALVVLLNGVLGFVQERRAETALDALRDILSPRAIALRDGRETEIEARDLVPGDVIFLEVGDKVPADAKPVTALNLQVDESVLTGESVPVDKDASDPDALLYAGTCAVSGRSEAVVVATGLNTSLGKIATLTGSVAPQKTDLQVQLGLLAKQLGAAALGIAALILALGIFMGRDPVEMSMTALSLSVAVVPEGLPAVVTITLALGASAMARRNALARRLQAVETLGAASVICTDKTGTLTENKMTVTDIWTPAAHYHVTGTGYDPTGHIERDGRRVRAKDDPALADLLQTAITCSHARLLHNQGVWSMFGAPTEGALVVLAYKGWADLPDPADILEEAPFNSDRKRMSVLARVPSGMRLLTKGAPEQVLAVCTSLRDADGPRPLRSADRHDIRTAYHGMAAQGLRVIALAMKDEDTPALAETDLTFLGLVGLIDPPRADVKAAIAAAHMAGIKVMMITGDSAVTARAIADQLGLRVSRAITGEALETHSDAQLQDLLGEEVLFARTKPADKLRIVSALQSRAQIVAMTGDGVNDAPALKQADIGVSMGLRGTDVAKDASDLVLLDDNFATIVNAIKEGRRQFSNVKKFVRYLLSSNAGEVVAILTNIFMGGPLIFLATQILWMNLMTDGITAAALGLEQSEDGQMREPPRPKSAPILGLRGFMVIGLFGLYTGLASLWLFQTLLPLGVELARTATFTGMVVFEKLSVFAFRSLRQPCWRIGFLSNRLLLGALTITLAAQIAAVYWPPLQVLLHTVPLEREHWVMIGALALPLVVLPELYKSFTRNGSRRLRGEIAVTSR